MRVRALLCCLTVAAGLAACGGDDEPGTRATTDPPQLTVTEPDATATEPAPAEPEELRELLPPKTVPRAGTGPAEQAQVDVVERWAATLRSGDVRGAARYWAVPSVAQNLTPPLQLDTAAKVLEFNDALTCGAVVSNARGAGKYLLVDFVLTSRKGGDPGCAASGGAPARVALEVRGGKIAAWYRVPGAQDAPAEPLAPAPIS